jgi:hypothetical protein
MIDMVVLGKFMRVAAVRKTVRTSRTLSGETSRLIVSPVAACSDFCQSGRESSGGAGAVMVSHGSG